MYLSHHLQLLWNIVLIEYRGNQELEQKEKQGKGL